MTTHDLDGAYIIFGDIIDDDGRVVTCYLDGAASFAAACVIARSYAPHRYPVRRVVRRATWRCLRVFRPVVS